MIRYYAVVHPMKAQYMCTTSQAKKVTVMVWLLASLLALPTSVARVHLPVHDGSKFYCVLDWDRPWLFQSHELYLLGVVLLVPGLVHSTQYRKSLTWTVQDDHGGELHQHHLPAPQDQH